MIPISTDDSRQPGTETDVFAAIADPVRRALMERLRQGPATAGSLASPFPISRPAVSRHLRVLRAAGLVRAEVHGRSWIYEIAPGPLSEVTAWVTGLADPWQQPLDALETEVYRTRRERHHQQSEESA